MYETLTVPRFDGGLNFQAHPAALQDHEWTWSNAFEPRAGCALQMIDMALLTPAASYIVANHDPVGIVADLMANGAGGHQCVLVPTRNSISFAVRLWQIEHTTGAVIEKTVSGATLVGNAQPDGRPAMVACRFNERQVLHFGPTAAAGSNSVATYDGINFAEINPSGFDLTGRYLGVLANHLVLGKAQSNADTRDGRLRWSDSGLYSLWDPAIDNTAGTVVLNSESSRIVGMHQTTDGIVVVMDDRIVLMRSTGNVPPFIFSDVAMHGSPRHHQWITRARGGVFVWVGGMLHNAAGSPVDGADKCSIYVEHPDTAIGPTVNSGEQLPMLYDERRNACIIPTDAERMYYSERGTWFRKTWEAQTPAAHTVMRGRPVGNGAYKTFNDYFMVTATGDVYMEDIVDPDGATAGSALAFVDTKDFALNEPSANDRIESIQVDWEPIVNGYGDALNVYAYVREELFPLGYAGTTGGNTDFTPYFTLVGTLSADQRQLALNLRGRYARFRFEAGAGRVRIRGFSLRRRRAADTST